MSHSRLFQSTIDDQDYLHLQLAHNIHKIDYELHGDDNSLYKGIHVSKDGNCCLSFPVKKEVQYFIKFTAFISENHLSLFRNGSRKKCKRERVEFKKFYKVGESLEKSEEDKEVEEDNVYTDIEKAGLNFNGLDFTTFLENGMEDNESESTSHKLVSLFRNVRDDADEYDLKSESESDNETIDDVDSVEVKSVPDIDELKEMLAAEEA